LAGSRISMLIIIAHSAKTAGNPSFQTHPTPGQFLVLPLDRFHFHQCSHSHQHVCSLYHNWSHSRVNIPIRVNVPIPSMSFHLKLVNALNQVAETFFHKNIKTQSLNFLRGLCGYMLMDVWYAPTLLVNCRSKHVHVEVSGNIWLVPSWLLNILRTTSTNHTLPGSMYCEPPTQTIRCSTLLQSTILKAYPIAVYIFPDPQVQCLST
jgi:hypothetical protein